MAAITYSPTQSTLIAPDQPLLTAEEFFATCPFDRAELINGKVVELMPVGESHGYLAVKISFALEQWIRKNRAGRVYVEAGFVLARHPDLVRAPDVAFLNSEALPSAQLLSGFIDGAPTLAVEIISPNDKWQDVEAKVLLYLDKGTRAVWIVDPDSQSITVRTASAATVYRGQSTLKGESVLPDFEMALSEVFEI